MKMRTLLSLSVVALGVAANAQVLDQITGQQSSGNGIASQNFGDFPTFSCSSVDNYSGGGAIGQIEARMILFNSPFATFDAWSAGGRTYTISTYSSLANATAGVAAASTTMQATSWITNEGGYGAGTALVKFSGLNLTAPSGGWVGVQGNGDFGTSGQIGVMDSTGGTPGDGNAYLVNPGGGFGLPGNQSLFTDLGALGNASYRIQAVPEPASMIALGAGLAALAARRRRK
ncbi:MAG: PEP-CTERM sorting domain-containing protein [Armatimonadetes bacterium]|nr:PEP-CTERM sorting domain-containing protein [Armatimonadota bacterium]